MHMISFRYIRRYETVLKQASCRLETTILYKSKKSGYFRRLVMLKFLIIPRFLALAFFFVTVMLLSFLLLGCVEAAATYSNVNLASVRYNLSLDASDTKNSPKLLLGYLNACYQKDDSITCSSYGKLSSIVDVDSFDNDIDILQIAQKFSSTCLPYILIVTICLTLSALAVHAYSLVPILPAKLAAKKVCMALTIFNVIFWGLGAMLQDKLVGTAVALAGTLSMNALEMTIGTRAQGMTWTAFAMMVVAAGCCGFEMFRSRKNSDKLRKQEIMQNQQIPQKAYYV